MHILQKDRTDLALTADHFKLDRAKLLADATAVVNGFRKNETEMPGISNPVADALDRGWHYATLLFGETQIRTGHLLVGILKSVELRRALIGVSQEFAKLPADEVAAGHGAIWAGSDEGNLRPMDGSGVAAAGTESASGRARRQGHDRARPVQPGSHSQSQGRTDGSGPWPRRRGPSGHRCSHASPPEQSDPDRRSRRRQDGGGRRVSPSGSPPATCPPPSKNVQLCALDVGLMQAGASMKGEFEHRLRSVIDEVQASPTPIILFIDEAHTLIGAGGPAGHGRRREFARSRRSRAERCAPSRPRPGRNTGNISRRTRRSPGGFSRQSRRAESATAAIK